MDQSLQQRLIGDLVQESVEALDQFDRDLLSIEGGVSDEETMNRVFRVVHSLKGTSGCLGLKKIERLSHAGENLLSMMRERRLEATATVTSALFAFGDALRGMIASLEAEGDEGSEEHETLISTLNTLQLGVLDRGIRELSGNAGLFEDDERCPAEAATSTTEALPEFVPPVPPQTASTAAYSISESAIRVNVDQLDGLMDLVGELVLARNQILQYTGNSRESALLNSTQRLNIITTRLQESVMKTRMQPIDNVWSRYPRIVRDVAHDSGKRVSLVMEGRNTELDRSILDAIKDPLIHLLRNAIDHGIETPEQRIAAGKPPEGELRLRAFHEGGQVIIEIRDDGAGIDRARVVQKAIERGLVKAEDAARMTAREVFGLLFLPGFSTAKEVTRLSGRGVGMDVVKQNIERIGGAVTIQSETGRSTAVQLKIPLTLAIIPALIILCGGHRFAIPQASLLELVRIDPEQGTAIEYVDEAPVCRLRGNLLPLVSLRTELSLKQTETARESSATDCVYLLVLQAEGKQFGLMVDSILDTEEIVVKPLGRELKALSVYAGATIMGDGCVALILDVMGLARRENLLRDTGSSRGKQDSGGTGAAVVRHYLVVGAGQSTQAAIELSAVARLEEFAVSSLERSGGGSVVQYRGEIMPLVYVAKALGENDTGTDRHGGEAETIKVVVYSLAGRNYGLVVDRIEDIVEGDGRIQTSSRPGLRGSGILQNRVTDFLDVAALLQISGLTVSGTEMGVAA